MFNYLPVNFDDDYYCERIYVDYPITSDSELFVAVLTHPKYYTTDLSIFSQKEWNTLLAISQIFEDESHKTNLYSAWEYQQLSETVRSSIYFLKNNCEYYDNGFSHLENLRGNKSDILDYVLENSRDNFITTNKFRKWVAISWDTLERKLKILSE